MPPLPVASATVSEDSHKYGKSTSNQGRACVAMAFLFNLIYGVSYAGFRWAVSPEVYPNAFRSKGVALAMATIGLCNFIVDIATLSMMDHLKSKTYIFFASWYFLAGSWAIVLLPETCGRTFEEMDVLF